VARFLLVHGARYGAWCWDRTIAELERRGHGAVAVDLPVEDPDAGTSRYAAVAAQAAARCDGPVVALGHSLGGLVIPKLAEMLPIEELVFVCAVLPLPGVSLADQREREPDMFSVRLPPSMLREGERVERSAESVIETFFHDCPDDVARSAADRLRPQATRPLTEPSPVAAWPPSVPRRYVMCRDDRIMNPAWCRRAVPDRLGMPPIELGGGHSPFLSRPAELVDVLLAAP
jgi:pimeloyl-ACP methyl ester carboxylesterase